jgi:hypothetical protein
MDNTNCKCYTVEEDKENLNLYRKSGLRTTLLTFPQRGKIKYVVKRLNSQESVRKQKSLRV